MRDTATIVIVNVGGTSVKCSVFAGGNRNYELRISCIGLEQLQVRENGQPIAWPKFSLEETIRLAVSRVTDNIAVHQREAMSVGYRVKVFRPSPVAYALNAAALFELAHYEFLQKSHADLLRMMMREFAAQAPFARGYVLPDHANLVGSGLLATPPGLPDQLIRQYGLFGIPQHGFAVQSALQKLGDISQACPNGVIVCHGGSGVTVNCVKHDHLAWASMLYSSCDGPMMTYRSGSLPTGVMLRLTADRSKDDAATLLSTSGIYANISEPARSQLKVTDLFDSPHHTELTETYICSMMSEIMSSILRCGMPDRLIFTGGIFERSNALLSTILQRLEMVIGRPIPTCSISSNSKGESRPSHQLIEVDEELVMYNALSGYLQSTRTDLLCQSEQEFRIGINRLAPGAGDQLANQPETNFGAFHFIASEGRLVDMVANVPKDADHRLNGGATHSLFIDRITGIFHAFDYSAPHRLT